MFQHAYLIIRFLNVLLCGLWYNMGTSWFSPQVPPLRSHPLPHIYFKPFPTIHLNWKERMWVGRWRGLTVFVYILALDGHFGVHVRWWGECGPRSTPGFFEDCWTAQSEGSCRSSSEHQTRIRSLKLTFPTRTWWEKTVFLMIIISLFTFRFLSYWRVEH